MNKLSTEILLLLNKPYVAVPLFIWVIFWKGFSLWKAATKRQFWWFVILLLVNSLGVLEIVYVFFLSKYDLDKGKTLLFLEKKFGEKGKKMKRLVTVLIILLLVGAGGFLIVKGEKGKVLPAAEGSEKQAIIFVGETCGHCQNLKKWLAENKRTAEKFNFVFKEVNGEPENGQLLMDKAKECNYDSAAGIGVPFLFDDGKCFAGDTPIIEYIKEKVRSE